jgi:phenylalanyl-tRNA synthetase beta chain
MIISLNWLKKYTDITLPIDELATLIGARLVEIEETKNIGPKYAGAYVVKVIECGPIEGTDHLNITKIDDGGKVPNLERDENGFIQVVCGAPNVRAGITVVWLPPGSTVPVSFNDSEPFVLTAKNLRGVVSNGMLASAKELDLFEDHTGILELTDDLTIGTTLDHALELDDTLLDIENKSLTHRPDTFGIIGFAREVSAIQNLAFHSPDWFINPNPQYEQKEGDVPAPRIYIDNPELSARYQAAVLSGADSTKQSPIWVQTYLSRVGVRPINAVVDVTNYLMMLTGQPLHAFDYDKVRAIAGDSPEIHIRTATENEVLELLDGRTITLETGDIVIAAGEIVIGLAGAMGGANTAIDETTKNIILESATFNLYNLRSTQMRHGIFSEAITRFTKGQPAALTAPVLSEAIKLMKEWSGAKRVSDIAEAYPTPIVVEPLALSIDSVNNLLGSELNVDEATSRLKDTEFTTQDLENDTFSVIAPFWRADIHIVEDVIEEIGRLRGFDSISPVLPHRDFKAISPSGFDEFRTKLRKILVRTGANEVLTYSFVHGDLLKKAAQTPDDSYRIINSISPDLQYYRQSLTPSLLNLVYPNVKQGYGSFALFELNKAHRKSNGLTDENVPVESNMLSLVFTKNENQKTSPYYDAKNFLEYISTVLGLVFNYELLPLQTTDPELTPFEPKRSAVIKDITTGITIGVVGEYKKAVSRAFKLPDFTAGFELNTTALYKTVLNLKPTYIPQSKYPSSERDVCFQVRNEITYSQIIDATRSAAEKLAVRVTFGALDIYQPEDRQTKNITIRIQVTSTEKTLTGAEVNDYMDTIGKEVITTTQATII